MNKPLLTFQDVLQLIELIRDGSEFSELRIRSGDLEIDLRRDRAAPTSAPAAQAAPALPASPAVPPAVPSVPAAPTAPPTHRGITPPLAAPASTSAPDAPTPNRDGADIVKAPMVGTIYCAPEPGAAPFVSAGQAVEAGDQLCIIEVMKLMNPIHAERAGTVSEILVGDGAAVEYGQALFVVTPR